MNGTGKRLLILIILGAVGALGIYLARQSYSAPPDNYQNGTPPAGPNAKPDKTLTPAELKKRLDSLPGAKM